MPEHAVVVIGASAGGLQAVSAIVERLPASLSASVLIVVHSSSNGHGVLPQILQRLTELPVSFARDGDQLAPGSVYVGPSDLHLLIGQRSMILVHGPRENGFRPAIDPLFRTAARELGRLVIGVVLSGALSDGTYGLSTIKQYGGVTIVQDPDDAVIPNMPQSAIESVDVDYVLPASEIAYQIERSARKIAESPEREVDMPRAKGLEPQQASEETEIQDMNELFGPPSGLTCPDCGGALWQVEEGRVVRYQCHVGHQYAPENLESAQRDEIDGALWSAVRVLEEHADLKQRMARRALAGGMSVVSEGFAEGARDAHQQAQRIRGVLFTLGNGKKARSLAADNPRSREAPRRAAVKKTRRSSARAVRKRKA